MSTRVILALAVLSASTVTAAEAQRWPSPVRGPMQTELSGATPTSFGARVSTDRDRTRSSWGTSPRIDIGPKSNSARSNIGHVGDQIPGALDP